MAWNSTKSVCKTWTWNLHLDKFPKSDSQINGQLLGHVIFQNKLLGNFIGYDSGCYKQQYPRSAPPIIGSHHFKMPGEGGGGLIDNSFVTRGYDIWVMVNDHNSIRTKVSN